MDRLLYTVPEAAKLLSVSENTVWNLLTRGELTGVIVARRARRITRDELERYVGALQET
jgi:excisionase family DNA binding protein